MIRAVSVLGFLAVAIGAATLGLKTADTDAQVADVIPAAASIELAPGGAISTLERPMSLEVEPQTEAPLAKTRGLSTQMAQQVSNKCRVPSGSVCNVRSKPVGSSCRCPGVSAEGRIIR